MPVLTPWPDNPTKMALLVIDVQNDLADPAGSLYVDGGPRVVARINEEIAAARGSGAPVVYTQTGTHPRRRTSPRTAAHGRPTASNTPGAHNFTPTCVSKAASCARARWDASHLTDAAVLVITELVTNAITHAHGPLTASISRAHSATHRTHTAVRLAVRDNSTTTPVLIWADPSLPGGRGIWLIDAVSRAWGTTPLHPGKVVWAVLDGHAA